MKRVVWTVTVTKQVCKGCVPVYTTSKLIELERLGCSGFEENEGTKKIDTPFYIVYM